MTPFGLLRVTTTHLEYYSALQRAAQVERLRELHREAVAQAVRPRPGTTSDGPFDAVERLRLMSPIDAATPSYRDAWELVRRPRVAAGTRLRHAADALCTAARRGAA